MRGLQKAMHADILSPGQWTLRVRCKAIVLRLCSLLTAGDLHSCICDSAQPKTLDAHAARKPLLGCLPHAQGVREALRGLSMPAVPPLLSAILSTKQAEHMLSN